MATIKNIGIKSQTSSKIYIEGYADNLETGYNYCIVYCYDTGANQNVGNTNYEYTFIKLSDRVKGSYLDYDFGSRGLYIPNEGWGIYGVKIMMVGNTCEDFHNEEDAKYIPVSETPTTPPPGEEPDIPPTCEEGAIVCEYNEAEGRYLLKKCVNGKPVYEKWCGADDTCDGGVCIPPAAVTPTPTCEEGAIVCEYNEAEGRYLLMKCVNGKPVYEKWCGASDTCEGGVCISPSGEPHVASPKYLTPEEAAERVRAGLPCYIKCIIPILDLLPGIPYTPGFPILPGFAITAES